MRYIDPALSAKRSLYGRYGGISTYLKAGIDDAARHEEMARRGKRGGRPRNKTIEQLMSQHGSCTENYEGRALPGVTAEFKLSNKVRELLDGCYQHP